MPHDVFEQSSKSPTAPDSALALVSDCNSPQGFFLRQQSIRLHVPENFDATNYPELEGKEHFAHWLLNKINRLQVCYKHSERDQWVHISQQTMRLFIAYRHVKTVTDCLLSNRIIECDGKYIPTVHSMGWRIAPEYRTKFKTVLLTNKALVSKMLAARIRWIDKALPVNELEAVHQHLHSWLQNIGIDQERARKLNEEQYGDDPYAMAMNDMVIDDIVTKQFDFTICKQGRVHHQVTRLFTTGRSCLTINGQPLASIDIANSQLIFFTLMLQEAQLKSQAEAIDAQEQKKELEDAALILLSPGTLPLVDTVGAYCGCFNSPSTQEFIRHVYAGTVYDFLMAKYDAQEGTKITRSEFKPLFFKQVLYNNSFTKYAKDQPLAKIMQAEFPEVYKFILSSKRWNGLRTSERRDSWKRLSITMQVRESSYMISKVCDRLRRHHAEVPVVTVHDSILATPEHMPLVERIMMEEFERLGVSPKLRVEGMPEATAGVSEPLGRIEGHVGSPEPAERTEAPTETRTEGHGEHDAIDDRASRQTVFTFGISVGGDPGDRPRVVPRTDGDVRGVGSPVLRGRPAHAGVRDAVGRVTFEDELAVLLAA